MTDERAGLFIESLLDGGDSGTSLPSLFGELRGQCVLRSKSKRETRAGSRTLSSAAGPRGRTAAGPLTLCEQRVGQPQQAAAVAEPAPQRRPERLRPRVLESLEDHRVGAPGRRLRQPQALGERNRDVAGAVGDQQAPAEPRAPGGRGKLIDALA